MPAIFFLTAVFLGFTPRTDLAIIAAILCVAFVLDDFRQELKKIRQINENKERRDRQHF